MRRSGSGMQFVLKEGVKSKRERGSYPPGKYRAWFSEGVATRCFFDAVWVVSERW
jgi:hypothetical protein